MKNKPLVGIDSLGRAVSLPTDQDTVKKDRLTGMFYFLWTENDEENPIPLYDISKITAADPEAGYKPDSDVWGKYSQPHYWGEPFYGYYWQGDEWVVRKHMKLLTQAGVDFLFFDTTNARIYEDKAKQVMRILQEYHDEGFRVPQVMFYTNTRSGDTVQEIYDTIYKPQFCPDIWFRLDGKPVIIALEEDCSPETRAFFNIKKSQWPNEPDKQGGWPWMDFTRPQRVFDDEDGRPCVINVSVAQHPQERFGDQVLYGETRNWGRAYHNGQNDPDENAYLWGYNFAEQFDRALETDPPIVLITGWNEWQAGRWEGPPDRPIMFVDCANYEYSRDIEMMRDGYFDNYYMQLVDYIRRYKGNVGCMPTSIGETTVFDNFADGDLPRDAKGWVGHYENHTQRNAITALSVSHTASDITFRIQTKEALKLDAEGSFMQVFLSKGEAAGFDFVVNANPDFDSRTTTVAKIRRAAAAPTPARPCDDLTDTITVGTVPFVWDDNSVTVTVPFEMLDMAPQTAFSLWIKAADSTRRLERVDQFYEDGDCAPLGRLAYLYRGTL